MKQPRSGRERPSATLSTSRRRRSRPWLTRKLKITSDQRITVRYAMQPMTPEETTAYLRHHTRIAGRSDTLFSEDAAAFLHHAARGYPRAVGRLAVAALLATYAARKTIADEAAARAAVAEVSDQ